MGDSVVNIKSVHAQGLNEIMSVWSKLAKHLVLSLTVVPLTSCLLCWLDRKKMASWLVLKITSYCIHLSYFGLYSQPYYLFSLRVWIGKHWAKVTAIALMTFTWAMACVGVHNTTTFYVVYHCSLSIKFQLPTKWNNQYKETPCWRAFICATFFLNPIYPTEVGRFAKCFLNGFVI